MHFKKNLIATFTLGFLGTFSYSDVHAQDAQCSGYDAGIGEVRVSLLTELQFYSRYGASDWALLDGRTLAYVNETGTTIGNAEILGVLPAELSDANGKKSLPDARGKFLRMSNNQKSGEDYDPEVGRHLGHYQADDFAKHSHKYSGTNHRGTPEHTDTSRDEFGKVSRNNWTTTETGGDETRPKNIAVNYFVRINKSEGLTCP